MFLQSKCYGFPIEVEGLKQILWHLVRLRKGFFVEMASFPYKMRRLFLINPMGLLKNQSLAPVLRMAWILCRARSGCHKIRHVFRLFSFIF